MKLMSNLSFESMMQSYNSNYKECYLDSCLDELRRMYEQGLTLKNILIQVLNLCN